MTTIRRARLLPSVGVLLALVLGSVLLAADVVTAPGAATASAADPCGPAGNAIACENTRPGAPASEWDVDRAGAASIQGFATDISVDLGDTIDFKIDTNAAAYTVTIYRTGYYDGDGARRITTVQPSASLPQTQPECITDSTTELYDCGNWAVSASWAVPADAVSGIYLARLERTDNGDASHITFIVRDDASTSDVIFQTSDTTWQAYNDYGGSSFYSGGANGRAYKLSYNRPVLTRDGPGGRDFYFANEYPMVRFLERNGYDVSYQAGVDTDRYGELLTNHDVFLAVGHDEYWSGAQRENVEAARQAGVHLMFLSGNDAYWRHRWEPSADASATDYRTLVSYKETWSSAKIDPAAEWTGTWRDPRYAPTSSGAGMPENALSGTAYMVNYSDLALQVSAEEGRFRLWRGTPLASLAAGTTATLAPHTVGYESNEDLDNGHRPPGLVRLSTTVGEVPEYLQDYGNTVAPGTTRHHLTLFRSSSGALTFSAGSVQWTWGLDAEHDTPYEPAPADRRMQQAQVNLFADMGVQPVTLADDLVRAEASEDTTGPTVAVGTPTDGIAVANGQQVTLAGTATDVGGGRVAGVEVSTNGGSTWHPAEGTTAWSYDYIQSGVGDVPVQVRAVDDSANVGVVATRTLQVSCPCSAFGDVEPEVAATDDVGALELGLTFTPTRDAFVSGVRFFKGPGNSGVHTGTLWSEIGSPLATATFTNETAAGWQSVRFSNPVPVAQGATYVVSYSTTTGHYAYAEDAFTAAGLRADPISIAGGFGAPAAGVFASAGQFPTRSFGNAHYFVDPVLVLTDDSPITLSQQFPLPGSSSVAADAVISATFSRPVDPDTVAVHVVDANGEAVPGQTTYDAVTRAVVFTPTESLAGFVEHRVTVAAHDSAGTAVEPVDEWRFRTARPPAQVGVCPCTIFDEGTVPVLLEDPDPVPVTLGMRFRPSADGTVTAIRFYKGPRNTGTHTGALWAADGTVLAEGTFTDESTSGWQTLTLDEPVAVTAGAEYVASYRTTVGRYSATPNAFLAEDLSRGPLTVDSTAGAYTYGTGFPGSRSSTSYLVDVVFQRREPTFVLEGSDPAPGAVGVARSAPITVTFSAPLAPGYSLTLRDAPGGTAIAGTTTLIEDGRTLRFAPSAALPADVDVEVALTGLRSTAGAVLTDRTWSFRTRANDPGQVEQTLFGALTPAVTAADDSAPVEVGVAFRVARAGEVTQLRFFKGPGNDGQHVASLWNAAGERLARVVVTGETASGWQSAALTSPVRLVPGQEYVVSYLAPRGHYAYTPGFFSTQHTSGDLIAPAGPANGRYLYGAAGGLPVFSWGAANYFVDVGFVADPEPLTLQAATPENGLSGVQRDVLVRARVSTALAAGQLAVRNGATPVEGASAISADGREVVFTAAGPLDAGTVYTVTLSGARSTQGMLLETTTWTFETEAAVPAGTQTYSLFGDETPAVASADDPNGVELGVVVTPSVDGDVTRIRFFKGAGNTGTHVGSIWTLDGDLLGRATFTDETQQGWQSATLVTPVRLTAGTSYVISYYAPNGHYSVTAQGLAGGVTSGPLHAGAVDNGRYLYGDGGAVPTRSWNAANYFVDIEFRPRTP